MPPEAILKTPLDEATVDRETYEKLSEVQDLRKTPGHGSQDGQKRVDTSRLLVALHKKGGAGRRKQRKTAPAQVELLTQKPVEDSTTSYGNFLQRKRSWYQRPEALVWGGLGGVLAVGLATYLIVHFLVG